MNVATECVLFVVQGFLFEIQERVGSLQRVTDNFMIFWFFLTTSLITKTCLLLDICKKKSIKDLRLWTEPSRLKFWAKFKKGSKSSQRINKIISKKNWWTKLTLKPSYYTRCTMYRVDLFPYDKSTFAVCGMRLLTLLQSPRPPLNVEQCNCYLNKRR